MFRIVGDSHREALLATAAELRRRIPADLPEILTLDDWNHPNLAREKPSSSETFRMLADVIATGDVGWYAPSAPGNTHWENWPYAGTL